MSKESRQSYKQFQCLQDALRADVAVAKKHGIDPVTAMAEQCRLSNYAIYKWIEEDRGIPAARLVTWAEVTGSDCALRYLIGEWGYKIVERRVSKPGAQDIRRMIRAGQLVTVTLAGAAYERVTGASILALANRAPEQVETSKPDLMEYLNRPTLPGESRASAYLRAHGL